MDDSHMMWSNVGLYIDHEDLICSLSIFSYRSIDECTFITSSL